MTADGMESMGKVFYSPFLVTLADTDSKRARGYGETARPNALKKSAERF